MGAGLLSGMVEGGRKLWEVMTVSRGDVIQQLVRDDDGQELLSQVIDLRNRQLREHLIKLGWTPPQRDVSGLLEVKRIERIEGDAKYSKYLLECGHWVVRKTNTSKKHAFCNFCKPFEGIVE